MPVDLYNFQLLARFCDSNCGLGLFGNLAASIFFDFFVFVVAVRYVIRLHAGHAVYMSACLHSVFGVSPFYPLFILLLLCHFSVCFSYVSLSVQIVVQSTIIIASVINGVYHALASMS